MTITLTQDYIDLPISGDAETPVKGGADDAYFAQTCARNLALEVASGRAPVLLVSYLESEVSTTSTLSCMFGRCYLPKPYDAIKLICKAKKDGVPNGEIKLYASRTAWDAAVPIGGEDIATISITNGSWDTKTATISAVQINEDRILYLYVMLAAVDTAYICVYADDYSE